MSRPLINILGQKFNRWTVLSLGKTIGTKKYWICSCDCGTIREVSSSDLRFNKSKSCGCLRVDIVIRNSTVHGHSKTHIKSATYQSWRGMINRTNNPNQKHYNNYGGRGIKVCDRWLKFENFLEDMGERPEGTSIDRIDNDGNYEPSNCRWSSRLDQNRNRRNIRRVK